MHIFTSQNGTALLGWKL